MNIRNCINCNSKSLSIFLNSEINPIYLLRKKTLICQNCGLAFKDIRVNDKGYINSIKSNYYSNFNKKELDKRFNARIIFDKTRAKKYYEYIKKKILLNKKKLKVLDIGGAEGWFANYIKINHPTFDVYNLEPDINAIKYGKIKYPEIKHICKRLEDIDKSNLKDIDIITYWGGFYRTAEPNKTINKIFKVTSKNANLFFSLPYTFDNPTRQDNTPYGSLDEIIGNGNIVFLNSFYLEKLFESKFTINENKIIQNLPFKKKIPILHMTKRNNVIKKTSKYRRSNYEYTSSFLLNYCKKQSINNINKFCKNNKISKIAIWTNPEYSKNIEILFKKTNIKKSILLAEDNWSYTKNHSIDYIYKINVDAIFVTDFTNQNLIFDQLIKRLHIINIKIIRLLDDRYINQEIYEKFQGSFILKKVFNPKIVR